MFTRRKEVLQFVFASLEPALRKFFCLLPFQWTEKKHCSQGNCTFKELLDKRK